MNYANINTQEVTTSLPTTIVTPTTLETNPTMEDLAALGWREVVATDNTPPGFVVTKYTALEMTPTTCRLQIETLAQA